MQHFGGKDSKRHFTVVMEGKEHGLYVSSTPSSAAKKAVTKLCAANKSKKVEFSIREITQGSKKKTYGPYLGEMKKLAKPIELKERVIRYTPEVHLNKKKSATKNLKKISGGKIIEDGALSEEDFIINQDIATNTHSQDGRGSHIYSITSHNFNKIPNQIVRLKYDNPQKPYIFFGKKICGNQLHTTNTFETHTEILYHISKPFVYYQYVVYLKREFLSRKVKFSKIEIIKNIDNSYTYTIVEIPDIPREELLVLKTFLENQQTNESLRKIKDMVDKKLAN
jgi:hypothetical protein